MVGEIRDLKTAKIAIQAALTGHLVFATLHTNDAPSAVSRLYKMGIEPFLIANSIKLVMAQRLVKTLCEDCKREIQDVDKEMAQQLGFTEEEIENMMNTIYNSGMSDKKKIEMVDGQIFKMYYKGFSAKEILDKILEYFVEQRPKAKPISKIGDIDANISNGANPLLQLRCFMAWLVNRNEL